MGSTPVTSYQLSVTSDDGYCPPFSLSPGSMLKSLLSLFLQSPCCLCQRHSETILCQFCQKQVHNFQLSTSSSTWTGNLPYFAWGKYEGQLKQTLSKLKYDRQAELGILLGQWLGQAWLDAGMAKKRAKLIVVPIPLHPNKQKIRGFNQAELIAQGFCQITSDRLFANALIRIKDTPALFGLTPLQRKQNLQDAFTLGRVWQQQQPQLPVLLIDDIYTTGTTVQQAANVLRKHNIKVYGMAVIATPKFTS
ncbi:phosphoribosyltransferase [Stanieria cyanosphaera PCC 7437]|uniref:Phosphoribosyltransferase n=1 Tax=Stanieria cyanosphaera (strain ATCC 29371 / PCC 7437) TaxID=111780 RepID=K9XZ40_STAC7|nr:ComF family protein [Stanieria cyanosphaera]AFZ37391.1 phosphoribosyltransferase [Stanieria cyanosphaera PCC 7437]